MDDPDRDTVPDDATDLARNRPWEDEYPIPDNPQSYLDQIKAITGMSLSDLTTAGQQSDDILHTGNTRLDHKKGAFGAWAWNRAVTGRAEAKIHIRSIHYFLVQSDDDIPTHNPEWTADPQSTEWSVYQNTDSCAVYISRCVNKARELGHIPYNGNTPNVYIPST